MLGALGYRSARTEDLGGVEGLLGLLSAGDGLTERRRGLFASWRSADIVFQVTGEEIGDGTDRPDLFQDFDRGRLAYDDSGLFGEATAFVLTGEHLKFLCTILNAKLTHWFLRHTAPTSGMGVIRWKKVYMEAVPIPCRRRRTGFRSCPSWTASSP